MTGRNPIRFWTSVAMVALMTGGVLAAEPGERRLSVPTADHHVHVWSEAAVEAFVRMQEETGETVISADEMQSLGGDEVVEALDSAGIDKAVLLSTAYFFGSPLLQAEDQTEYEKVRAENDYVAGQVARYPDRLVALFSVNPLADYAVREMDRLAGSSGFVGLKLHLANSRLDFRNPDHARRLRDIFEHANRHGYAVLIHLYTAREHFGGRDVEIFVDEVLPAAPDVPVQVAHFGGGGGFGPDTIAAVDAFVTALEDHPVRMERVFFDLSGVPHPEYLAEGRPEVLEQIRIVNQRFVNAVRRLGSDRIVYGTDWPVVSMARYLEGIRKDLPMDDETLADLIDNPAPYLFAEQPNRNAASVDR